MIGLLVAVALGAPDEPNPTSEAPTSVPAAAPAEAPPDVVVDDATTGRRPRVPWRERPYKVGGLPIPLFDYNTTDGVGLGLGIEIFDRKREQDHGYRNRVSGWTFWTTAGTYSSNWIQYEHRGKYFLVARAVYRRWTDMIYVGSGGVDVAVDRAEDTTRGNLVDGPSGLVTWIRPVPGTPVMVFAQTALRYTFSEAAPGGLLAARDPYGLGPMFQFDLAVGVSIQETDRWPVPNKGVRFEASARAGGSVLIRDGGLPSTFEPLAGVNLEAVGWWPLVGQHLVLGGRLLVDKTFGRRPWWDQEYIGGVFREELAEDSALSGYARSRTRGDGVIAAALELRPKFGQTRHPTIDIGFYGSVFAEVGWLFEGADPGPVLPTVGVGPVLLWQGAVELRPFASWGWYATPPSDFARPGEIGPRTPQAVFGIATSSPL